MEKRTKFDQFRTANGLSKKDLADYLGVSAVFVGKVCSGQCKLPTKHYSALMNNQNGWDTSMLQDATEEDTPIPIDSIPQLFGNKSGIELLEQIMQVLSSVQEAQRSAIATIRAKDEQILSLMKIVENLTQK